MELPSYYPSGAKNFEVALRLLRNVYTPDIHYVSSVCITGKSAVVRRATFDTLSSLWATKCFVFMLVLFIFSVPLVTLRFSRKSNLTTVADSSEADGWSLLISLPLRGA